MSLDGNNFESQNLEENLEARLAEPAILAAPVGAGLIPET